MSASRELLVTPQFECDFKIIDKNIKLVADNAVQKLVVNVSDKTLDVKKLHGFSPALWRLRIGHFRLIFSYTSTSITLHRFRHRKDVYGVIK